MSSGKFDAYHEMLGIPPEEQPPHHYRLLGIALFETSPEVISNATSRQMRFVRDAGVGAYTDESQRLLNEIATAKICLLNADKRRQYDEQLGATLASNTQPNASLERRVGFNARQISLASWVVGQSSGCDIVIDRPTVSRFHCRLDATADGLYVSDSRSRNGTFVDGHRIDSRQQIDLDAVVTLGKTVAVPWPHDLFTCVAPRRVLQVGRDDSSDMVLSDPTVSTHHAQVIVYEDSAIVQDLASANGTYLGQGEDRAGCMRIQASDTVRFGHWLVAAEQFWIE